jgi:sarcosine oxidase
LLSIKNAMSIAANRPRGTSRRSVPKAAQDNRFMIDQHPGAENSWIVGAGSGHGFKHGPAVGERAAALILGKSRVDPFFALARLSK